MKYYYFNNSYILTVFFLQKAEERCVIRVQRHDVAIYLMGILDIESVVSWVHSLSFWLTVYFTIMSLFFFFFFFLALRKGPRNLLFIPSSFQVFFIRCLFPALCRLISFLEDVTNFCLPFIIWVYSLFL